MTALTCRNDRRRQLIRERSLNGIDYVDVIGTHLCVHFLTGIPAELLPAKKGEPLTPDRKRDALQRIVIRGGRRVKNIKAVDFAPDEPATRFEQPCLGIEVDKEGDFSTYTLCFVELKDGHPTDEPMRSLDPRYAYIGFTFKSECPAEVDCQPADPCTPATQPQPSISYLAKDYASFRQLILDRLSLIMPKWRERHVPDIGIALVELLAYAGDSLSYYQDAVGTEQYLDTARQRISVRRHARLVDYAMHEGCNARAFLDVQVRADFTLDTKDVYFVTRPPNSSPPPVLREEFDLAPLRGGWLGFEPLTGGRPAELRVAHNLIRIYTWGDRECCLPKGATCATLLDETAERDEHDPGRCREEQKDEPPKPKYEYGHYPPPPPPPPPPRPLTLKPGDFLIFEELACAGTAFNSCMPGDGGFDGKTTQPDADKTHRHVVRLTNVAESCDELRGNRLLEVEWSRDDALPFPLCVSAIGTAPQCDFVPNLAVARGNVLLVDHGLTIADEPLPPVPPEPFLDVCEGEDDLRETPLLPGRYRPKLRNAPLTFAEPLAPGASATALRTQ
ncbi:MAG TPA: putative baseplate assembly protein, partial [Thermoanaerobaculia bacterium]|nr:putative baseplate assembly protein [Thermoanaerobaculia bacterium]